MSEKACVWVKSTSRDENKKSQSGQKTVICIALGLSIGAALSTALKNPAFIGIGIAIRAAIGALLDAKEKENDQSDSPIDNP